MNMSSRYDRGSTNTSQANPTTNFPHPFRRGTVSTLKRPSKLGREVFTSRPPLAPRQSTTEQLATDKLLFKLGFLLLDNSWYHPRATFGCVNSPSIQLSSCKWGRGTIFRYPAPTGTRSVVESLYRPLCVNENCQWNSTSPRVMRLNPEGLVSLDLASLESDTLPKKFKGKPSARNVTFSSAKPVIIEPSTKNSSEESITKRKISGIPSNASTSTPKRVPQAADPSHAPPPSSSSVQIIGTKRKGYPPADTSPQPLSKAGRVAISDRSDFQSWEERRAQSGLLSTGEKLDMANREIAELKVKIDKLEAAAGKRRKGN